MWLRFINHHVVTFHQLSYGYIPSIITQSTFHQSSYSLRVVLKLIEMRGGGAAGQIWLTDLFVKLLRQPLPKFEFCDKTQYQLEGRAA